MNPNLSQAITEIMILARQLQEVSAGSDRDKEIFEHLFKIGQTVNAGMQEIKRDK